MPISIEHGAGTTDCAQCSDKVPVPPRARYVKKRNAIILGFDHDCFWMGVPIGFRNRKFFILFVLWSTALSLFGAAMSAAELYHSAPIETLLNSAAPANSEVLLKLRQLERSQGAYGAASPDLLLLSYQISTMKLDSIYFSLVLALLFVADVVAGLLLGCFGTEHVKMAMRNQRRSTRRAKRCTTSALGRTWSKSLAGPGFGGCSPSARGLQPETVLIGHGGETRSRVCLSLRSGPGATLLVRVRRAARGRRRLSSSRAAEGPYLACDCVCVNVEKC